MSDLAFHPVSIDRFSDLVAFFAQHGNPNYCWCMRWRLKNADFQKMTSSERRARLQALVQNNIPTGVMAYSQSRVVGWCSVAPRETYPLLEGSTTLKRIDNLPVWSVVCFFVAPDLRRQKLPVSLLQAAVKYALSQGAVIIEGYPVEPDKSYRFMGSPSTFAQAGFREAGIAKNGRKIVRWPDPVRGSDACEAAGAADG
jgi:GNAT superfamily N-acetyltransferase